MNINATLIGQMITFAVFLWFCWKYIWPPIITAMRERQAAIAEGLAASERAEKNLEEAKAAASAAANPPGPEPMTSTSVLCTTGIWRAGSSIVSICAFRISHRASRGQVDWPVNQIRLS